MLQFRLSPCDTLWFTVTRFLLFRDNDDDVGQAAAEGEVATASADWSAAAGKSGPSSGVGRRGWGLSSNGFGWEEEEEACSEKGTAEFALKTFNNPSRVN